MLKNKNYSLYKAKLIFQKLSSLLVKDILTISQKSLNIYIRNVSK